MCLRASPMAATDANAAYQSGDVQGAADIMAQWAVGFGGGVAGGAFAATMTAQALAPLLALGLPGVIAGGVLTIGAGIVGGIAGEEVFLRVYDIGKEIGLYLDQDVEDILDDLKHSLFSKLLARPGAKPQIWRDPNIITFDRLKYDFQAPGPYVAVKGHGVDDRFEIQTFHRMISMGVSVITAAASRIGETPIEFYLPPRGVECSTERNDVIRGSDVSPTVIYGGPDTGNAQIFVEGEAALLESDADRSPSFGYYVSNGTAPVLGQIIWANLNTVPLGSTFNISLSVPAEELGYFMIPGGSHADNLNRGLADGVSITFQLLPTTSGSFIQWAPSINGTMIKAFCQGYLNSSPMHAVYSDTAFNREGYGTYQHTNHEHHFEGCHTSVIVAENVHGFPFATYGDTLIGGAAPDTFGYHIGRDGVDRIQQFDVAQDSIILHGDTSSEHFELLPTDEGTFISTTSSTGIIGGMLVENVSPEALVSRINFTDTTTIPVECVSGTVVPFYRVRFGGNPLSLQRGEMKALGEGLIYRSTSVMEQYTIVTEEGDGFKTRYVRDHLNIYPFLSRNRASNTVYGLLGTNDGNWQNDLAFLNGTAIDLTVPVPAALLYGEFADNWCVMNPSHQSLFISYSNLPNCSDPRFTGRYVVIHDFPQEQIEIAEQQAVTIGYNRSSPIFEDIVFEILAGGVDVTQDLGIDEVDFVGTQGLIVQNDDPLPQPSSPPTPEEPTPVPVPTPTPTPTPPLEEPVSPPTPGEEPSSPPTEVPVSPTTPPVTPPPTPSAQPPSGEVTPPPVTSSASRGISQSLYVELGVALYALRNVALNTVTLKMPNLLSSAHTNAEPKSNPNPNPVVETPSDVVPSHATVVNFNADESIEIIAPIATAFAAQAQARGYELKADDVQEVLLRNGGYTQNGDTIDFTPQTTADLQSLLIQSNAQVFCSSAAVGIAEQFIRGFAREHFGSSWKTTLGVETVDLVAKTALYGPWAAVCKVSQLGSEVVSSYNPTIGGMVKTIVNTAFEQLMLNTASFTVLAAQASVSLVRPYVQEAGAFASRYLQSQSQQPEERHSGNSR